MDCAESSDRRFAQWTYAAAAAFAAATSAASWARWANFQYRTFDLAYYIQAIWQLIHGRLEVSVEHVPLLGNHVEPVVILFAPLFAVFQHPMLFVVVQNAALATLAPVGFSIARRLGIGSRDSLLFALALLLTPAAGYIALHEFHPEALTAPFLLLMLHARVAGRLGRHWLWLVAVLACKENMALVLAAYCVVNLVVDRQRPAPELRKWYVWPLVTAVVWFVLCTKVITPALNSGGIDYLALYSHLGQTAGTILLNAMRQPQRIAAALWHASLGGNLLWASLLPFLALPLLRWRWIIVASPVFLQHLLSWRSSEWMIYFHYAAPLLPLLWIAMVEAVARLQSDSSWLPSSLRNALPAAVVLACVFCQVFIGPAPAMAATFAQWSEMKPERERKSAFISSIPPSASVTAPLPYLSHLAAREKLYSLHYILKGLKTLSRAAYEPPPPTDFVLIDYNDTATFDASAGYYHPQMKTADGRVIASSDQLLHNFIRTASWSANSQNELTMLQRATPVPPAAVDARPIAKLAEGVELVRVDVAPGVAGDARALRLRFRWNFADDRKVFPWLLLRFAPQKGGAPVFVTRGLCAPEAGGGAYEETWVTDAPVKLTDGDYAVDALFIDNTQRSWLQTRGEGPLDSAALSPAVPLGVLHASGEKRTFTSR